MTRREGKSLFYFGKQKKTNNLPKAWKISLRLLVETLGSKLKTTRVP
jgi:hypothetical protein